MYIFLDKINRKDIICKVREMGLTAMTAQFNTLISIHSFSVPVYIIYFLLF